jgi:hypothetical protein
MACRKIDRDPKYIEDLEDLRHLTFKEPKGTRDVKDTNSDDFNSSYSKPLNL